MSNQPAKKPRIKFYQPSELAAFREEETGIRIDQHRKVMVLTWDRWTRNPYEISLSDLQTPLHILRWVYHLSGKTWVTSQQIHAFIEVATKHTAITLNPFVTAQ